MKSSFLFLPLLPLVFTLLASSQVHFTSSSLALPNERELQTSNFKLQTSITAAELKPLAGDYSGQLVYRDYTSDEIVSMPLNANARFSKNTLKIDIRLEEGGKIYKQHYRYRFDGATVYSGGGDWAIEEKQFDAVAGKYRFVITRRGRDGNNHKPCLFRLIFSADPGHLTITKEVRFDGTEEFFVRNEYRFGR